MKLNLIILITIFIGCTSPAEKPNCSVKKSSLDIFPGYKVPYSGFLNLDSALVCSRKEEKPVLAIYSGYTSVSDYGTIWNVLLEEDVKSIVDNNYIIAFLNCEDTTLIQVSDTSTLTIGTYHSQQQITKYYTNQQPLYVILDKTGEKLSEPIGYTPIENRIVFIEFLKNGLNNSH